MKKNRIFYRFMSFLLAICIALPNLPIEEVMAASNILKAAHTMLVYTEPFQTDHFSHIDITNITNLSEYIEEKTVAVTDGISQKEKWRTLTQYDKLSPGEIHRRVQDDIYIGINENIV